MGSGDNSKSMVIKLFEYTLGEYCFKFPNGMLTTKPISSGAANPELAQAKGALLGLVEELESDEAIRTGMFKKMSGGDSFYARQLQSNGGKVKSKYKTWVVLNDIPPFTSLGKALYNRVLILPFMSEWVDSPPKSESEQYKTRKFKKDIFFEDRIPELAYAFMWKLVQYYPIFLKEGLTPPKIVIDVTQDHWKNSDPYRRFFNENLELVQAEEGPAEDFTLSTYEILAQYREWFRMHYPKGNPVDSNIFFSSMKDIVGKSHGTSWVGIRYKADVAGRNIDI